jgi:hypothetical protein
VRTARGMLTGLHISKALDPAGVAQHADQEFLALVDTARGKNRATPEESVRAAETVADRLLGETEELQFGDDGSMPVPGLRSRAIRVVERLRKAKNGC